MLIVYVGNDFVNLIWFKNCSLNEYFVSFIVSKFDFYFKNFLRVWILIFSLE